MAQFPWAREHLMTREEGQKLIEPYAGVLASCWMDAWDTDWSTNVAESTRNRVGAMQRGGVIHDLAVSYANERVEDGPQVNKCADGFFKVYILSGTHLAVLRFLKLTKDGRVSLRSRRLPMRKYFKDAPLANVDGRAARLVVGYILNPLHTEIVDVRVVLQRGEDVVWQIPILAEHDAWRLPTPESTPEDIPGTTYHIPGDEAKGAKFG